MHWPGAAPYGGAPISAPATSLSPCRYPFLCPCYRDSSLSLPLFSELVSTPGMDAGGDPSPAAAGASVEDELRVRGFDGFPSPAHFSAAIEPTNVPAVFVGAVKDWEAFSIWDPRDGGLDYLLEQVGSATVEAMLSRSAPIFYGDLRSHERVPTPFSTFINACKLNPVVGNKGIEGSEAAPSTTDQTSSDLICAQEGSQVTHFDTNQTSTSTTASEQLYLAQVPILNIEHKEGSPLENLSEDIKMPLFLETKPLISINLWMNNAHSRSSTHYDPHHNLLCVVAGCKQVVLWPPSASRFLYPMPVYGEASNHSFIDIQNPDLSLHSKAKDSMDYSQKVILHAGDALFIPEGWFHQVDSDDLTIAVNFWWQSSMMTNMLQHMDAYYMRRILNRLVDKEMNLMLCGSQKGRIKGTGHDIGEASGGKDGSNFNDERRKLQDNEKHGPMLNQMETAEIQALHKIVSLVHETMNVDNQNQSVQSANDEDINREGKHKLEDSWSFEDDPIATILWNLEPLVLQRIFLVMVRSFPRTLEALIVQMLSPMAAEVLTRKFDEMDQQTTKGQQNEFYQLFYGVFDDPSAAMTSILNGKESFAFLAFRNVLGQYLGVNVFKQQLLHRHSEC
uniref:tRNA wybutosine-synthesizing protein 5 n=1 Tax=Anthurium amnicola TaxID=1678845 RepID=A0A1D1Z6Y6_9ARAE